MNTELVYFLQQLVNGLAVGGMYAMIAVGYSMVYSLLYQINFAHGDLYVFGTFITLMIINAGVFSIGALVLGGILTGLIAMFIERIVYRPIRFANRIVPMLSALGAALVLRTVAQIIWGPEPLAFPPIVPRKSFLLGNVVVQSQQIVILIVATVCVVGFTLFMQKTKTGRATQCIMQDITTSSLMGIPINKIIPIIYALGGFFGVVGGVLFSSYYNMVSLDMGMWGTTKSWAAAMLGGVGSFYGAFAGGLILGFAETMAGAYISTGFKDALGYIVIVLVLLVKPSGLFGKKKIEKV